MYAQPYGLLCPSCFQSQPISLSSLSLDCGLQPPLQITMVPRLLLIERLNVLSGAVAIDLVVTAFQNTIL